MLQEVIPIRSTRFILFFLLACILQHHALSSRAFAEDNGPVDEPNIRLSRGIPIASTSKSKEEGNWLSRNKWWVALGTILLGGTAAALANGGGGSDGGSNEDNGSYFVDW